MTTQVRKNVMDMFIDGARRGFTIATTSLLPNVVMAFVIIQALKVTGLLEIVGRVCDRTAYDFVGPRNLVHGVLALRGGPCQPGQGDHRESEW